MSETEKSPSNEPLNPLAPDRNVGPQGEAAVLENLRQRLDHQERALATLEGRQAQDHRDLVALDHRARDLLKSRDVHRVRLDSLDRGKAEVIESADLRAVADRAETINQGLMALAERVGKLERGQAGALGLADLVKIGERIVALEGARPELREELDTIDKAIDGLKGDRNAMGSRVDAVYAGLTQRLNDQADARRADFDRTGEAIAAIGRRLALIEGIFGGPRQPGDPTLETAMEDAMRWPRPAITSPASQPPEVLDRPWPQHPAYQGAMPPSPSPPAPAPLGADPAWLGVVTLRLDALAVGIAQVDARVRELDIDAGDTDEGLTAREDALVASLDDMHKTYRNNGRFQANQIDAMGKDQVARGHILTQRLDALTASMNFLIEQEETRYRATTKSQSLTLIEVGAIQHDLAERGDSGTEAVRRLEVAIERVSERVGSSDATAQVGVAVALMRDVAGQVARLEARMDCLMDQEETRYRAAEEGRNALARKLSDQAESQRGVAGTLGHMVGMLDHLIGIVQAPKSGLIDNGTTKPSAPHAWKNRPEAGEWTDRAPTTAEHLADAVATASKIEVRMRGESSMDGLAFVEFVLVCHRAIGHAPRPYLDLATTIAEQLAGKDLPQ